VIRHLGDFPSANAKVDARRFDTYLAAGDQALPAGDLGCVCDRVGGAYLPESIESTDPRSPRSASASRSIGLKGTGPRLRVSCCATHWTNLDLHQAYLTVLAENPPAIRLCERVGFAHEGELPGPVLKQEGSENMSAMGYRRHQNEA
jgi:hypothetical protein